MTRSFSAGSTAGGIAFHALWTLPGGGIEFDESIEEGTIREVKEETGYDAELVRPLTTHSFTESRRNPAFGSSRPRPFKGARVVFEARITGGTLGTLEVGGTTDRAAVAVDRLPRRHPPRPHHRHRSGCAARRSSRAEPGC
jgi:ADP-ribose pyrophosphatase YjhB (NUDIX family)